jgi:hypothetical protein
MMTAKAGAQYLCQIGGPGMLDIEFDFRPAAFASHLRHELRFRNLRYAERLRLKKTESRGELPVICYLPSEDGKRHGNFLPEAYRTILRNRTWRKRLQKIHSGAREALPRTDRRWCELDSSNSSDALLMNIFCFPGTLARGGVLNLLGIEPQTPAEFGFRAHVPFTSGKTDRTEVDMKIGDLLVEAKLTESDFQSAPVGTVEAYRDFHKVFDGETLPRNKDRYVSYQLIRNVLAAYAHQSSFCVMIDARRPDLLEAWYTVMRAIALLELRLRCKVITWQELAGELPHKVQEFLEEKYGILPHVAGGS